jgi:DNA repair exonuclease SbcCD ATPase subunit
LAASITPSSSLPSLPTADTAIATKKQIAASNTSSHVALNLAQNNADAQLAISQGNALKDQVAKHAKKFSTTVSTTVSNTRRLLELVREASPDATNPTVDALWNELEELFAAANEAKEALPVFLEKQRDNMSLYHSSMVNEAIKDTQEELKIQHKKVSTCRHSSRACEPFTNPQTMQVNIQHSLILEHQEAFLAHKERTADKLKELEGLQERVSRLTLEKGNFRTEIDKYMHLLEQERSTKAEDLHKVGALEKELETLVESNKQLLAEVDTLRKALQDLQAKMQVDGQETADRFTAQLKSTVDLLSKETQKTTALNTMISQLKGGESTARLEAEKAKKENRALNEKYSNQAAEHAKAFAVGDRNAASRARTRLMCL